MTGFGDPLFNPLQDNSGDKRSAAKPARSSPRRAASPASPIPISGRAPASIAPSFPACCRNCPTPPTNSMRSQRISAFPKAISISASDASETTVKRAPLADYSIVYFATHGLVAGDVKGIAEPSLALSIPKQPSELDDGLLTVKRSGAVETQRRLGGAVSLQHDRRRQARRRSAFGTGALVLLCRRPCIAGVALGGGFRGRHAPHDIDLRSLESPTETWPRRGAASVDAGLSHRPLRRPETPIRRSGRRLR